MKKLLLMIAAGLLLSPAVSGVDKISSSTWQFLNPLPSLTVKSSASSPTSVKAKVVNGVATAQFFLHTNGYIPSADITSLGGSVNARFGDRLILVTLPVSKIGDATLLHGVKQVSAAKALSLKTDVARDVSNAAKVWEGDNYGLPQGYDGTDVVLGIIDDGIEFNHVAFKDSDGNTRVKRVYMPNSDITDFGEEVTINGETLTGRQFITPEDIAQLTTDDTEASHGTHTASDAGGSLVGKYSGMAPGVDLVLCGCGDNLSDAAIAQSALYIAEYARSVGKPCVISVSLGSNMGPHDGTSNASVMYDAIAEEYNAVILLANGNEADINGSLYKEITNANTPIATGWTPTSAFSSSYSSSYNLVGALDIWNSNANPLRVKFVVLNSSGRTIQTTTSEIGETGANGTSITGLTSYFGNDYSLEVYSGLDETNNRYNVYVNAYLPKASSGWFASSYKLGVIIYGSQGDYVTMWTDSQYSELTKLSNTTYSYTAGDGTNSLCDDVTGNKTISVGAWASRLSFPYNMGNSTYNLSNGTLNSGDIAYFSSYGTDHNGVTHPFISAPGHTVVSGINRYDTSLSENYCAASYDLGNGESDYWEYMSGTSMATPVCAGIVALWKQIDPSLTVDDVKEVMTASAIHDSNMPAPNVRWGQGKVDALAGAEYILARLEDYILGDANSDKAVNVFDVVTTSLYTLDKAPSRFSFKAADVNEDGVIDVTDIVGIVNISLGLDAATTAAPVFTPFNAQRPVVNTLSVTPVDLHAGESIDITIDLSNNYDITAMQLDLSLPAGVTASNARLSARAAGHTVSLETLKNGRQRVLAYSADNELIEGYSGTLLTLTLTADDTYRNAGELRIDNISIVDPIMERTMLEGVIVSLGEKVPTVTAVNSVEAGDVNIYALGSQVVIESPTATTAVIASISGRAVNVSVAPGRNTYDLPGNGVYIVKAGEKVLKINVTK